MNTTMPSYSLDYQENPQMWEIWREEHLAGRIRRRESQFDYEAFEEKDGDTVVFLRGSASKLEYALNSILEYTVDPDRELTHSRGETFYATKAGTRALRVTHPVYANSIHVKACYDATGMGHFRVPIKDVTQWGVTDVPQHELKYFDCDDLYRSLGHRAFRGLLDEARRWNGWASPLLPEAEVVRLVAANDQYVGKYGEEDPNTTQLRFENGILYVTYDGETYEETPVTIDGVQYWDVQLGWTWSELGEDEDPDTPYENTPFEEDDDL